jgi:hypothetical protein
LYGIIVHVIPRSKLLPADGPIVPGVPPTIVLCLLQKMAGHDPPSFLMNMLSVRSAELLGHSSAMGHFRRHVFAPLARTA